MMKSEAMLSWPCPLLALGELALHLAGHCSKRVDPYHHRRAGPNDLGMRELPLPRTQER